MSAAALVVSAGSSRRMGFNKLTALLHGKPVLQWSLEAFDRCEAITQMIVVVGDATRDWVQRWIEERVFETPIYMVGGGTERHLSVNEGLKVLSSDIEWVAIHDAARPLLETVHLSEALEQVKECKALTFAHPVTATLKRVNERGEIEESLSREGVWAMETPQVFCSNLIRKAYAKVLEGNHLVTDEVSAVQLCSHPVKVFQAGGLNLKITFPSDLVLAEQYLKLRTHNVKSSFS